METRGSPLSPALGSGPGVATSRTPIGSGRCRDGRGPRGCSPQKSQESGTRQTDSKDPARATPSFSLGQKSHGTTGPVPESPGAEREKTLTL